MGARWKPGGLTISSLARRMVEYAAAEAYPLEVGGVFIHDGERVVAATPFTKYQARSGDSLIAFEESSSRAEEIFGDLLFGEFHSHPDAVTGLSQHDFNAMEDDDIEWVVSVWPGKRKWCFRHRIYSKHEGKIHIVPIRWI